ncbi:flagellar transcriptional regulator FlhD [Tepidimonas taiwanensis]|uniref:Flagellar transcriptional regulator FlhD n=1 Tax=Tepidimonas taiwanensis TaxID=307486 RepID=A0A554WY16_9BURK|nr:flagellar transcriptional regulator FlhD [Tepidimonas taiwanensis]MCX7693947.1 flagellar transcriptional regulator FlhD [Tepidimonas taiwanensis]MDM7463753.1 flagellar transcriptional regulator FlhD [Tepidimonas taiwanensis]TSE28474.1 Flagellar transcriptional regulator FlhD [Tepidimonas taiwanensis]UBQ05303.1 flagellar transcriptional regulator FlhD [Tepidimonas taiwanensis]
MTATATLSTTPALTDAEREQLLADIREANLTYLMLAQRLIRADKAEATFRLGLSEASVDLLAALSPAQLIKLASQNTLLCRFQADDEMVFALLTSRHAPQRSVGETAQRLHANILMASRLAEAAA